MAGELVVELAGDAAQLGQAGPGDGGEVVVLVVQADVVGEEVEGPVVRVRLRHRHLVVRVRLRRRHRLVHVVLGDEVARQRMQAARQERRQYEVQHSLRTEGLEDDGVEGELDGYVGGGDPGKGHAVDAHGSDGVEKDLEGAEEGLSEDRVEEDSLEGSRQVGIETVDTQGLVMRQVIRAEGGAIGDADGQVGDDGEESVRGRGAEG